MKVRLCLDIIRGHISEYMEGQFYGNFWEETVMVGFHICGELPPILYRCENRQLGVILALSIALVQYLEWTLETNGTSIQHYSSKSFYSDPSSCLPVTSVNATPEGPVNTAPMDTLGQGD